MDNNVPDIRPDDIPGTYQDWKGFVRSDVGKYLMTGFQGLRDAALEELATESEPILLYRAQGRLQACRGLLDTISQALIDLKPKENPDE